MKKIKIILIVGLLSCMHFFATAQEKSSWKELDNFHSIMSKTFHPSEEGNLNPLKEKSDSLVILAQQWKAALIPAGYKLAETEKGIKKLTKKCVALNTAVKNHIDDAALTTMLKEAHEAFHYIVEECKDHK